MDIADIRIQILIVLVSIAFLWLFFKALKVVWKLTFFMIVFLALSFALPAMRQWLVSLF